VEVRTRKQAIPRAHSKPAAEASKARILLARSPVRVRAQIPDFRASNRAVMPVGEILLLATCKMGKVGHNLQGVAL
jgi:hypothetical protein